MEAVKKLAKKELFEVAFDPAKIGPLAMLDAVRKLRYRPSVEGPVRTEVSEGRVEIRAEAGGGLSVKLVPGNGKTMPAMWFSLSGPIQGPEGETRVDAGAERTVELPFERAKDAKAGWHEVSVAGRLEDGRKFAIRVPVELEPPR